MNIHNRFFSFRVSKQEVLFFIYGKNTKYGFTYDPIYGIDWGRANR